MRVSVSWLVLIALIFIATALSAVHYFIQRDYLVVANVTCDPQLYSCFVGDGEDLPEFYMTVSKPASQIPACNAWKDECSELSCNGETGCEETYCLPDSEDTCDS